MIICFYDKDFKGEKDNAALVVDNSSFSLVRRAVDCDDFKCRCEAFTENIQPAFVVLKNDLGNYIYGALAGVPQLTKENQTEITAADVKTLLKSDVILDLTKSFTNVNSFLSYVFGEWNTQVNQGTISSELRISDSVGDIAFDNLKPSAESVAAYDAPYLKYYGLYMTTQIDLVGKKIIFNVGKSMCRDLNVKLWELGIYDYGKWVTDVNETQGYVLNTATNALTAGFKWILRSDNSITTNVEYRNIYPIKRRVVVKETEDDAEVAALLDEANSEALKELTESMFQENIEIDAVNELTENMFQENIEIDAGDELMGSVYQGNIGIKVRDTDFETKFNIYVKRSGETSLYKSLPCGELHYDGSGLKKVQIGYRLTGIQFII